MVHFNGNGDNNFVYLESQNNNEVRKTENGNEKNINTRTSPDNSDSENVPTVFQDVNSENNHIVNEETEKNPDIGNIGYVENDIIYYTSSNYVKYQIIILDFHVTKQTEPLFSI